MRPPRPSTPAGPNFRVGLLEFIGTTTWGALLLFTGMPVARLLTVASATLCAVGHAALWLTQGRS